MSTPIIEIHDVSYEYPETTALSHVSCTIAPKTITALVGPNGAGKSTLLSCIAALKQPHQGTVIVNGLNTAEQPRECHTHIGFLPDFYGLYESLTTRQCLHYMAMAHKVSSKEIPERIEAVVEALDMQEFVNKEVGKLSRGQRQRVGIGQAIIHGPEVVLLDEPAAGLDPEARHRLSMLLLGLKDRGMTLIVSSHILAELEEYASDMLIIEHGKVVDYEHDSKTSIATTVCIIETASSIQAYMAQILSISGVTADLEINDCSLSVHIDENKTDRGAVLKQLIDLEVPVIAFAKKATTMKDRYLSRSRSQDSEK